MTKNKLVQTIKEALDNLSVARLSHRQKAEAIADEIEKVIQQESESLNKHLSEQPFAYNLSKGNSNGTH